MPILYSYTPEEVEKFKAKLKQTEERAAFFEKLTNKSKRKTLSCSNSKKQINLLII